MPVKLMRLNRHLLCIMNDEIIFLRNEVFFMTADQSDDHNVLWSVLSYFIFIVGIILALVWWKSRNTNAKAALYGTGCSIVVLVVDRILKAVLLSSSFNFIGYLVGTLVMFIVGLIAAIMLGNRANNE